MPMLLLPLNPSRRQFWIIALVVQGIIVWFFVSGWGADATKQEVGAERVGWGAHGAGATVGGAKGQSKLGEEKKGNATVMIEWSCNAEYVHLFLASSLGLGME